MSEAEVKSQGIGAVLDRLGWGRVLLVSLAGALLVGGTVFLLGPLRYTARTSLLISDRPDAIASLTEAGGPPMAGSGGWASLVGGGDPLKRLELILKSHTTTLQLVRKYRLDQRLRLEEERARRALAEQTRLRLLSQVGLEIGVTCPGPSRLQTWLGWHTPFTTAEAKQLCADLANAYVAALDEYVTETSVAAARDIRQFIEKRKREVATELARIEDHLQELQTRHKLIDPEDKVTALVQQTQAATRAYAEAKAEAESLAHSLATARSKLAQEDATRIAQEVTARNPVIASLEEELTKRRIALARELEAGKAPRHPDVRLIQTAIASAQQQLQDVQHEVKQQISREANPAYDALLSNVIDLEVKLMGTRARHATYRTQLDQAEASLADLPPVVREHVGLARQRQLQAELLTTLSKRLELAAIEEQRESSGRFQVLDPAVPPLKKSGPSSVRSAAITFCLLALTLGLIVAHRRGIFRLELSE